MERKIDPIECFGKKKSEIISTINNEDFSLFENLKKNGIDVQENFKMERKIDPIESFDLKKKISVEINEDKEIFQIENTLIVSNVEHISSNLQIDKHSIDYKDNLISNKISSLTNIQLDFDPNFINPEKNIFVSCEIFYCDKDSQDPVDFKINKSTYFNKNEDFLSSK